MDSLTQALLGASVGEAILGKKAGNRAMAWGALGGTIPDLDVLSQNFVEPLRAIELHRAFSHSIIFCVIAAVIIGLLISKIHSEKFGTAKQWMWMMFACLFTHVWLDAHTTWGTQVFWPLEYRVAFNNIFIIDPLYTLPFLFFVLLALTKKRDNPKRTKYNRIGLIVSSIYMLVTIILKGWAFFDIKESLQKQSISYQELETRPTPFNSVLWNATVEQDDAFLIGYYSLFDSHNDIQFMKFDKNHALLGKMADEEIVKRLIKISEGKYIIQNRDGKIYFNDLRFGQRGIMSPDKEFVFSYELSYDENKNFIATETPKSFDGAGEAIRELWERLKGV
ncbi:MAG: metal-dependent hydrolase [Bacteroidetes bacterium]|nr:MAG: metal-dependent hydrolase [Bacteroidota bacterium]REK05713.1 MAG: metal-dependent hydrolase [Bacteroidota bacterium]REK31981.1 MAG: metal-dependent hydrolase [Bacteroidota bacterium]REK50045.1 MAG: metal-dependent hydrolase [Bacteroidota bacterium]